MPSRSEKRSRSRGRVRALRSSSRARNRAKSRSWSRDHGTADTRWAAKADKGAPVKSVKRMRKDIFNAELGYKDESNPFGDTTLTERFVWKKKNEYLAAAGLYKQSNANENVSRIEEKIREIQQVKKRRDEREVEKQLLEQQRQEHDKERHDEEFDDWVSKEEAFHLENVKVRSSIRIEQGRERPIDLVSKALAIAEGEINFDDMTILDKYPHQLFLQMSLGEVEEMALEIEGFAKNDHANRSFWKAMRYVAQDALEQMQRDRSSKPLGGLGAGVAEGVVVEIHELLSSKSGGELEDMLDEIRSSVREGAEGLDTQFFDAVSSKIPLYIARAEIEEMHNRAREKCEAWRALQRGPSPEPEPKKGDWEELPAGRGEGSEGELSPALEPLSALAEEGAHSPVLEPLAAYDPQELLDPEEDSTLLRQVRRTLVEAWRGDGHEAQGRAGGSAEDSLFASESAKGMGKDEVAFNGGDAGHGEVTLSNRHYDWEDKYKPRKPRFFNRVKTGFEWNKYNQTHYDHDNPPPKIVQGYKFNIFYPDLIDKVTAPKYYIEKADSDECVILRFHAGPPYEDVAFKIVNREWQLCTRFGFRVVFDRGVLQLYFNFKRWRYRR